MSGGVQVFGRRDDDDHHALWWPAFEKRQGTKSREVKHRRCSGLYGELATACGLIWLDVIVFADRFTLSHGCSRGVGREYCAL